MPNRLPNVVPVAFSDKKEKWVPVAANFTTKRPGAKRSTGKASDSKNWREDSATAKGKSIHWNLLILNSFC